MNRAELHDYGCHPVSALTKSTKFLMVQFTLLLCLASVACNDALDISEKELDLGVSPTSENSSESASTILEKVSDRYRKIKQIDLKGHNRYHSTPFSGVIDRSFDFELRYRSNEALDIFWNDEGKKFAFSSSRSRSVLKVDDQTVDTNDDPFSGLLNIEWNTGKDRFEIGRILFANQRFSGMLPSFEILGDFDEVEESPIDGKYCYMITGRYRTYPLKTAKYWIEKSSYLIIQYQRETRFKNNPTRISTTTERYNYGLVSK